jgi:hypothetical protein
MAQMPLADHDNMVKALPSDRAAPFRNTRSAPAIAALSIPNAYRPKAADEYVTVDGVAVTDDVSRFYFPTIGTSVSWREIHSAAGCAQPPRGLDFHRQYAWKPARCQRITVSGLTIARASSMPGAHGYNPAKYQMVHAVKSASSAISAVLAQGLPIRGRPGTSSEHGCPEIVAGL